MSLPTLYKLTKTGAIQIYNVVAKGAEIIVTKGQLGDKLQTHRTICILDKEQTIAEVKLKWKRQIDLGYSVVIPDKTATAEYQVTSYKTDKDGHTEFVCVTRQGRLFDVELKDTDSTIKSIGVYLGKWLVIEFKGLSEDLVPLEPLGLSFRLSDKKGHE